MNSGSGTAESQKRECAIAALSYIESGMVVGLGTGSTARHFIELLAGRIANGKLTGISGVPTSVATEQQAGELGIPLVELPSGGVDVAVDGMDEVDASLRAIKGLGGALTREKIVASSAATFVLIGDESKRVEQLGAETPVPVEVVGFGLARTRALLADLGLDPQVRKMANGEAARTDNGNPVLDCRIREPKRDLGELAQELNAIPGVVEHGLFLDQAHVALIATGKGITRLARVR